MIGAMYGTSSVCLNIEAKRTELVQNYKLEREERGKERERLEGRRTERGESEEKRGREEKVKKREGEREREEKVKKREGERERRN